MVLAIAAFVVVLVLAVVMWWVMRRRLNRADIPEKGFERFEPLLVPLVFLPVMCVFVSWRAPMSPLSFVVVLTAANLTAVAYFAAMRERSIRDKREVHVPGLDYFVIRQQRRKWWGNSILGVGGSIVFLLLVFGPG